MNDLFITALLVFTLFVILGSGVWIGLSLSGVAWVGMQGLKNWEGNDDVGLRDKPSED